MKLSTVEKRMSLWFEAALRDPLAPKATYLRSAPGRGKTTVLSGAPKAIGEKLNMNLGLVVINGGLLTPPDVLGYGVPKHFDGHSEMVFTDPFFFRTTEGKRLHDYDGGLIVVDEADKMDVDCKKVVGEGALSGRFGPHQLPPNWFVWFTGNRIGVDRSGSTKELDHMINRIRFIDVSDDIESLLTFMEKNNAMSITMAFAKNYPGIVFEDAPKKQGPWCTPRSLMATDAYLRAIVTAEGKLAYKDPDLVEEVSGQIGDAATAQMISFMQIEDEMPKYETIVARPTEVKVPTNKPDACMLIAYTLAHRVDEKDVAQVVKYVERMDKEFGVTFLSSACKRNPKIMMAPAVQKWAMENASLMAAITK